MAGDVSITRGIGFRDDFLTNNNWNNFFPPSGTLSQSTDGDLNTVTAAFGAATVAFDECYIYRTGLSSPRPPYNAIAIRLNADDLTDLLLRLEVRAEGGPQLSFDITPGTANTWKYTPLAMGIGTTIDEIRFTVRKTTNGARTYNILLDFIQTYKETLTLPAVSEPLQLSLPRTVVELSIPSREGGILQDIGSDSARLEISGALLITTTPNNYTADQWWDVLVGTWLEGNWQWLASDRVNYKYQIEELLVRQDPGRVNYYQFKMRLKKLDILTATAQTFAAIQ